MSQQHSGAAVGAPLTETVSEDSIADYLKSHPDFFERHAPLVLGLKLPHRAGGATISLVEKIHQLCLKLMRAPTLIQRLERLETGLREDFAAERAVLVLFRAAPAEAVRDGFVRRMNADDPDVRPFATFLRAAKPRCGPLRDRQKNIFEHDADVITSAALVPLGTESKLGFLIIGSRDPDHFHPGKRMDFLARLGEVLAVAIRNE